MVIGEHHPGHCDHRAGDGREQAAGTGRTGAEEQRPSLDNMQIDGRVHGDQDGGEHHGVQNHHSRGRTRSWSVFPATNGVVSLSFSVTCPLWSWFFRLFLREGRAGSNRQEILPVLQRLSLACLFLDDDGFAV